MVQYAIRVRRTATDETQVRVVIDEDIGLKILYEAPSDAHDADPASSVEYESITPPLSSAPSLTALPQYRGSPWHRRAS